MTMKILNPSANARANCWPYLISNSLYDVNFHIRVLQGDAISWSVFLFDNDAGVQT